MKNFIFCAVNMICQEYENATFKLIKGQSCYHRETSQLICFANHSTGFYMMPVLVFNELKKHSTRGFLQKKGVLEIWQNSQPHTWNFTIRLQHRCFTKFLRAPFLIEHLR